MTLEPRRCPRCGSAIEYYRNPVPAVDLLIETEAADGHAGLVLIQRRHPPLGWALPGGFIHIGESAEQAALREAREETGLEVILVRLHGVNSKPGRDPRGSTLSVVYVARAQGPPRAGDDAAAVRIVPLTELHEQRLAFDHDQIVADYLAERSK
jgi:8-oxo-dGTP diphosphatase